MKLTEDRAAYVALRDLEKYNGQVTWNVSKEVSKTIRGILDGKKQGALRKITKTKKMSYPYHSAIIKRRDAFVALVKERFYFGKRFNVVLTNDTADFSECVKVGRFEISRRFLINVYGAIYWNRECAGNFIARDILEKKSLNEHVRLYRIIGIKADYTTHDFAPEHITHRELFFNVEFYERMSKFKEREMWAVLIDTPAKKLTSFAATYEKAVALGEQRLATVTLNGLKITGKRKRRL